uniref:Uncharacterized protein n=1 Tax=Ammopiptanthus mongolicus TaxID=126911 RepID=A0A4P8PJX7_AMMMO|nr:hypothetical protein [Ammopiptanthus mongolicus]
MSVSALIRLQCIPIHSLCVGVAIFSYLFIFSILFFQKKGKAKPSALHCRGKGDTVPKGWLVLVTETDTDKVLFLRDPLLTLIIPTSKRSGCSFIQGQRGE